MRKTILPFLTSKAFASALSSKLLVICKIENEDLKSLFTELSVEPIRSDGEVSERYVESIIARLHEVAISRTIADTKSKLQRINPTEDEYQGLFSELVALEAKRRALREKALGSI